MFDTHNFNSESRVVAVTKEIEKTITPDKVTEMYDKVKDEVVKSIIRSYKIESNHFRGSVTQFEDVNRAGSNLIINFLINGDEKTFEEFVQRREILSPEDAVTKFRTAFLSVLSNELTKEAVVTLIRKS